SEITGVSVVSKKSEAVEYDTSLFSDRSKWAAERLIDGQADGTGWCSLSRERYERNRKDLKPEEIGPEHKLFPQEIIIRLRERRSWTISSIRLNPGTNLEQFLLQEDKKKQARSLEKDKQIVQGFKPNSDELKTFAKSCWAKDVEILVGETRKGDSVAGKKNEWEWRRQLGEISLKQDNSFQTISFKPVEAEYIMLRIKSNWGGDYVSLAEVEVIADGPVPGQAHAHAAAVWPNVAAIGYKPNIVWQLLAYLLLTSAEVMVSITCLEFSYTQAPKKVKSFIMALYLLSVSAGNAFTSAVNFFVQKPDGSSMLEGADYYWFFTAVMLGTALLFIGVAKMHRGKTYIQEAEQPESKDDD
ncbi:MAG: hypothetical protein IH899_02090, partial [Planctomycetes bacterium]|nr:hypothetical protein [Planctomycetota bacterium]